MSQQRPDNAPKMNNRQLAEFMETLKKATDRELGSVFVQMGEQDPFKNPANRYVLNSKLREYCYNKIEQFIRNGMLTPVKNN